ncbi:MAG TPA: alpha/beta hydrolase [Thermoplasmata archaeon]|jgi:pimeloyl-ACP methyl ester carboxylesterase|nr:alpha/beta hydrolase [Thermoplasmata archaeon]
MCALEAEEGFARAPDGRRIAYRVSGKGPFALVMPANWGVDSYIYTRGLSPLEFWLALVTFDPRGVGRSDPVEAPQEYSMDVTARDAASVADALHLGRTAVLGHSNGGAVALTYALAFPERVSHLLLISTGATWDRAEGAGDGLYPSTEEEMRRQVAASIPIAVHEPSRVSRAMHELLPRMHFSPDRFRWTGEVEYERYDLRPRLRDIRVPVLVLHGRQDRVVSVQRGEELHRGIAGSHLEVLESCGHWPFVERRQEFVEAVRTFLALES